MNRLPPIIITIRNDSVGKPYVVIDSLAVDRPVNITLWAEDVHVEDLREITHPRDAS